MFLKKHYESDKKRLLELMDQAIECNYDPVSTDGFYDKELVEKYNKVLALVAERNNVLVIRLNDNMLKIGDSTCVKEMIEQLNSQTSAISNMRGASQDFGSSIQNIQNAVQNIQENTHEVKEASDSSMVAMENSVTIVKESVEQIVNINEQVTVFREKATKINEIIDSVKEIARTSGLLSINASIEAARAGEAGRSFAIVASQMKDLSANTTSSAEDIVKYVEELVDGIIELESSVNNTTKQLQDGNESVHKTIETLKEMSGQLNDVSKDIDLIYEEIQKQSVVTENFVNSVESIAESYDELSKECFSTGEYFYRISRASDNLRNDVAKKGSVLSMIDWVYVFEVDHFIFTWRLYNNLIGFENLTQQQVSNYTGCKFGKWAANQTNEVIIRSQPFKNCLESHKKLHECAVASWQAKQDNDRDTALRSFEQALETYNKFKQNLAELKEIIRANVDSRQTVFVSTT